ncbi:MAG: hypothetical protein ACSLFN_04295 [Candidatus Limnocylindrales bacterium]
MRSRRRIARGAWFLAGVLVVGACGSSAPAGPTYSLSSAKPPTAAPAAVGGTRADLVRVLGEQNLVLQDSPVDFRPAEGPALASAPRSVYQVILPDDPTHGYVVVYALRDVPTAAAAGADQAAYLATGPGRVQMPIGTQHIIRQVGASVVLYSWIPGSSPDERTPLIADALASLGIGIDVPG